MSPCCHSPFWGRVSDTALLGGFDNTVRSCTLLAAGFRDQVAEPIDVSEHVIEIVRGALELSSITFAVKGLRHRVFDGEDLVEELRNRLTQLHCVSSSWRRCKHDQNVGTKAVLFKALGHRRALKSNQNATGSKVLTA